jgi:iron complex outermembrane receptor protein
MILKNTTISRVWNERNYNILFKGFETGQDFANQILTNPKFNYLNVSAQTGASLNISNELKFKISYILSQRAPNPSELFSDGLHHAMAAIEYGSLSLEPETSHKFLFSFSKNNKNYNWSLEPYISKTFGYIFIEPTGLKQTIRGAFPVWTYDSTDAFMTGIDINSSININRRLMFDVGASYTYAEDILNKEPIILIPPLNTFQKLKFTPLKGMWSLEFTHQTSAKQNRFPNSNFIFDYIEDGKLVSETVDISSSPRGFQKLDVIFSILIGNKNNIRSNLRLIIQNITNSDYRDYLNRMRFYSSEIGRNFQVQLNFNY